MFILGSKIDGKYKSRVGLPVRPINGIWLNGCEFVLDKHGDIEQFQSIADTKKFAMLHNGSYADFEDGLLNVYKIEKDGSYVCVA